STLANELDKPICLVWLNEWLQGPGSEVYDASPRISMFRSMTRCMKALRHWLDWHARRPRLLAEGNSPPAPEPGLAERALAALGTHAGGGPLSESHSKALLVAAGVPITRETLAADSDAAAAAARAIGFPVALKIESPDIPHKTEAGVIRLGVPDEAAVRAAAIDLFDLASSLPGKPVVNGVLVQQMVLGGVEMMIGARCDPQFGPLVLCGFGGIDVELTRDVAVALAPVSLERACSMILSLRRAPILTGFRKCPPLDVNALADAVCRVSQLVCALQGRITEIDVNPFVLGVRGGVAVDATQSLRNRVAIVGVGESDIGKIPGMSGLGLNAQAARRALEDSGLKVADIDGVLTAYSFTEPYFMLGTVLCEYLGVQPRYNASMVVGGATPAVMLKHAAEAIAAGSADTVLVCAGENRATGQSRDQAVAALMAVGHPYFERPYGPSIPGMYAMISRRHMEEFGTTERQMASVAVTARHHASMHPNAHMRKPISVDDVMASKPIADPLKILDCCLLSDAGGAFIVTSADRAKDLKSRPVYLAGIAEFHTHEHIMCAPSLTEFGARKTSEEAYRMAGLGPCDVNVAQLYDCFTVVPMIELEEVGLCERG
ncbi:MAG: hypothetical protein EBT08_15780, partial [Betaproteobacteria bacterium]|nr:hypothetical protein [Betaproteobacteria bacterium]